MHNRLTHSLEVSCIGRSLGNNVAKGLIQKYPDGNINFPEVGSVISAACLTHDMGSPLFGHSGERAIFAYFSEGNGRKLGEKVRKERGCWENFIHFEGNASATRLLTHQFTERRKGGFALTCSTLAFIIKYPYASIYSGKEGKFGFFQSEERSYLQVAQELGIGHNPEAPGKPLRYPLVCLVEAADGICYQIIDIEDACKLYILTTEEAMRLLLGFFGGKRLEHIHKVMHMVDGINEQITYLRSCIIGLLMGECSRVFLENEESILNGTYSTPLISNIYDQARQTYANYSATTYKRIYKIKEVLDIELTDYHIFSHLIDSLIEAVVNQEHAYSKLLLQRIPERYNTNAPTTCGKIQCILDYISGMTDVHALDLYHKIIGMSLPAV